MPGARCAVAMIDFHCSGVPAARARLAWVLVSARCVLLGLEGSPGMELLGHPNLARESHARAW